MDQLTLIPTPTKPTKRPGLTKPPICAVRGHPVFLERGLPPPEHVSRSGKTAKAAKAFPFPVLKRGNSLFIAGGIYHSILQSAERAEQELGTKYLVARATREGKAGVRVWRLK